MRTFCLWFTLAALIIVSISTYFWPDQGVFWLASNDLSAHIIRGVLGIFLVLQMLTTPPRHALVRIATGAVAVGTAAWAWHTTSFLSTPIFDSVLLMLAAVTLGITALELPEKDTDFIIEPPVVSNSA